MYMIIRLFNDARCYQYEFPLICHGEYSPSAGCDKILRIQQDEVRMNDDIAVG